MIQDIPRRGDVGKPEATRDPIFLLEAKHSPRGERWYPESVWFTREEAEAFRAGHAYRWPHGSRVYCLCAEGELARLLKAVTDRAPPPGTE